MKKLTTFVLALIFLVVFAGCSAKGTEASIQSSVKETTSAIVNGTQVSNDLLENVTLRLPENITREFDSNSRAYFRADGEIIGGIEILDIAGQRNTLPYEDEYTQLAITVTNLVHNGEYDRSVDQNSAVADLKVEFKFQDGRTFYHYFFFGETVVYDIWVDHDVLDSQDMISILKTLYSEDIVNPQDSAPANEDTSILNLRIDLPEGIICVPATTTRLLFFDVPWEEYLNRGNAVGGVEVVNDVTDMETLESAISALGQQHLGGEYIARSLAAMCLPKSLPTVRILSCFPISYRLMMIHTPSGLLLQSLLRKIF